MGRLMIGRGDGASVAEVAASLPAHRLGAMEELKSSENPSEGKEEGRDLISEENWSVLEKVILSFIPPGF